MHYNINHSHENINLQKIVRDLNTVKTKAQISPERRRFMSEHGFKMKRSESDINEFLTLIDDATLGHKYKGRAHSVSLTGSHKERTMLRLSDIVDDKERKESCLKTLTTYKLFIYF